MLSAVLARLYSPFVIISWSNHFAKVSANGMPTRNDSSFKRAFVLRRFLKSRVSLSEDEVFTVIKVNSQENFYLQIYTKLTQSASVQIAFDIVWSLLPVYRNLSVRYTGII
ncbi:hypothetical protein EMIT0P74_220075 [Pseudomonas sp. IT-P74]